MKRFLALLLTGLLLLLAVPVSLPAFADEGDVVMISSLHEWKTLAERCRLDAYSRGIKVVLSADLDFEGHDLISIPLFSGSFDGGGHTIKNFRLAAETSTNGVFRIIQKGGKVSSLNVSGILRPAGTAEKIGGIAGRNLGEISGCSFDGEIRGICDIGGIAGTNETEAVIENCSVKGSVSGQHRTGGIAGENRGTITACRNAADVGTIAIEEVRPEKLDLSLTAEELIDITDIGGIAGLSSGLIRTSSNTGEVGYARIGYNIGGIAGRQSGFTEACENRGTVRGRKDVGGITGQLDPDTVWDFSESNLVELHGMLNDLQGTINNLINDAQWTQDELSTNLENFMDALSGLGATATLFADRLDKWMKINVDDSFDLISELQAKYTTEDGLVTDVESNFGGLFDELLDHLNEQAGDAGEVQEALLSTLQDILANLSVLGNTFSDSPLLDDIQAVSDQAFAISDFLAGMFNRDSAKSSQDYVRDISENLAERTVGIISSSDNTGTVEAETNAGGIAGAVSIEFSFDREDELDLSAFLSGGAKYLVFAACDHCSSNAEVHTFKDAAGGIAGRMDYGALVSCKAAGNAFADANYAGGIAGYSKGLLKDCRARCSLSASRYQGGIAGLAGDLYNCLALPFFEKEAEYQGSIAGAQEGALSANFYTDSSLGAIDGFSYKGQAQMLSHEKFLNLSRNDTLFRTITLTFVFEDGSTKEVTVPFGDTVKDLPKVPDKDGKHWQWDPFKKTDLEHNMTINGSYVGVQTTLATEEEVPLFLIEGAFYDGQTFTVEPYTGETGLKVRPKDELFSYTLNVDDYTDPVTVRMRNEKDGKLYLRKEGATSFVQTPYTRDGSYIVFESAPKSDIAFLATPDNTRLWVIIAILAAAVAILTLIICLMHKKMKASAG